MEVQQVVKFTLDDMVNAVRKRKGRDIIAGFADLNPHAMPDSEIEHGRDTSVGKEMGVLIWEILKERGLVYASGFADFRECGFSLFRFNEDRTQNQYVPYRELDNIPVDYWYQNPAVISDAQEQQSFIDGINTTINQVVHEVYKHRPNDDCGTVLEKEFLYAESLLRAIKRFVDEYVVSFDSKFGLSHNSVLDVHLDIAYDKDKTPYNRKSHGVVRQDSRLYQSLSTLYQRILETATFQLSPDAPDYRGEFTVLNRLSKYLELNAIFAPRIFGVSRGFELKAYPKLAELQERFQQSQRLHKISL